MADTEKDHNAELRARIQGLMAGRGVTAEHLAEAAGVPKLVKSITGDRAFSSYELACVAEFFRVTTMWLITGEERSFVSIRACNLDDVFGTGEPEFEVVRDYRNERGVGYVIESRDGEFRWSWVEGGETDVGEWEPTLAAALRAAADDWQSAGDGGTLSRTLRSVATREERRAATAV